MIATVINQGKPRWMIFNEPINGNKLIEFMQAVIQDAGQKSLPLPG